MNKFSLFLKKANWKKIAVVVAAIPLLLLLLFFSARNFLLHRIIDSKTVYYKEKRNVNIHFGSINFTGFSGIQAANFSMAPENSDTLVSISSLYIHVRILPLLLGHVRVDELMMDQMNVRILKTDSTSNYSFLVSKKKNHDSTSVTEVSPINFAETADLLLDNVIP